VSIFDQIFLDKHKVDPKDPKWFYKLLPIDDDPYPYGKDEAQRTGPSMPWTTAGPV
jgi:hypothetical protein